MEDYKLNSSGILPWLFKKASSFHAIYLAVPDLRLQPTGPSSCAVCLVAQSCLTLCDSWTVARQASLSMGILQATVLEDVAMPFSKGSSPPRDWFLVSGIAGRFFTIWAIREAPKASESVSCSALWKSQSYISKYVLDIFHFICKMNSSYFSLKSSFSPTFLPCMVPNCCRVITWNKVNFCFSFLFFNL